MKKIEDFLKKKLHGRQEPGSKSQNDQLWSKIDSALSTGGPKNAPPRSTSQDSPRPFWWMGVLGAFALTFIAFCVYSLKTPKTPTGAVEVAKLELPQELPQDSSLAQVALPEVAKEAVKSLDQGHQNLERLDPGERSKIHTAGATSHLVAENEAVTERQQPDQANPNTPSPSSPWGHDAPVMDPKVGVNPLVEGTKGLEQMRPILVKPWASLPPMLCQHVHKLDPVKWLALRTFGGLTTSQTTLTNALKSAYSSGFGAGGGVSLDWVGGKQHWSAGVGFYEFTHVMEHQLSVTTEFINAEGVQTVLINSISGDTTSIVGPVSEVEHYQRHILSYNRLRQIALPLEWRKEHSIGRWTAGIALGATALFRIKSEGHLVTADSQIFAFSNLDLPRLRLNVSPTTRIYAGLQVQPEWRIDLSWTAGIQTFNSSRAGDMTNAEVQPWKGRISSQSIQVGVTRFFATTKKRNLFKRHSSGQNSPSHPMLSQNSPPSHRPN